MCPEKDFDVTRLLFNLCVRGSLPGRGLYVQCLVMGGCLSGVSGQLDALGMLTAVLWRCASEKLRRCLLCYSNCES